MQINYVDFLNHNLTNNDYNWTSLRFTYFVFAGHPYVKRYAGEALLSVVLFRHIDVPPELIAYFAVDNRIPGFDAEFMTRRNIRSNCSNFTEDDVF